MRLNIKGAVADLEEAEVLTAGRVGLRLSFAFDSLWDGLSKMAVFTAGSVTKDVIIVAADAEIPPEIMLAGERARVGVFGYDDGDPATKIIPTVWASLGYVHPAADPNEDPSVNPTLPVWGQIINLIGNLNNLTTEAKNNLVAAINEIAQGEGGGGTSDHRQLSHRNEADQHTMAAITGLIEAIAEKQDTISDLENIRSGAALGATALQTAPVSSVNGKTGAVNLVPADLGIGSVFQLKGSKPTYADLPASGNTIGDVWYVVADSVGYIWLNDGTADRWEQLGKEIDLSAYRTASAQDAIDAQKQSKITASGLLKGDGSGGVTAAEEGVDYQTAISFPQNVGEFLVVGSDGKPTTRSLDAWEGGSY